MLTAAVTNYNSFVFTANYCVLITEVVHLITV